MTATLPRIRVPQRFLAILGDEATKITCNKAENVTCAENRGDHELLEMGIGELRSALDARDAILRADDDTKLAVDVLRLPAKWALDQLHYQVSEHDHNDLDQLAADVEILRDFAAWSAANVRTAEPPPSRAPRR